MKQIQDRLQATVAQVDERRVRPAPIEVGAAIRPRYYVERHVKADVSNAEVGGDLEIFGIPLPVTRLLQLVLA